MCGFIKAKKIPRKAFLLISVSLCLANAKAHVAFLSLLYIIRLYSRINELVFISVSHLFGQVVQALVVLRMRDCTLLIV